MPLTAQDFQRELNSVFASAMGQNLPYIDVKAGDLHRQVGGYPGHNHRIPVCCEVMERNMKPGDVVLSQPPSGQEASKFCRLS